MFLFLIFSVFSRDVDKLDLPILRRIAEDDEWPPLNIYVYPLSSFPAKFQTQTQNSRFFLEKELPNLIKKSKANFASPKEADLYLVPVSLSGFTSSDFTLLINHLKTLGPYYDEYKGANHIFLQGNFPTNYTAITKHSFLDHPGHILTEGFVVEGESVKTWVFAKNLVLPLLPRTKFVNESATKINKVAVDISTKRCLPHNQEIRNKLKKALLHNSEFDLYEDHQEALKGMETHQFSIVSACETEVAEQFYDALNALSVPIVFNNIMRFPFESELIDYTKFVVHLDELSPETVISVPSKLRPHLDEIKETMLGARKMLSFSEKDGEYVWALVWSLYMKLLSWLPTRRTKIIDNIFRDPSVFAAA